MRPPRGFPRWNKDSVRTGLDICEKTNQVGTVRVEFSSIITGSQVNQRLVDETTKLIILAGDEQLDTLEGTGWDETCTVTRLGTPGDLIGLGVTNGGVGCRRGPEAEVFG